MAISHDPGAFRQAALRAAYHGLIGCRPVEIAVTGPLAEAANHEFWHDTPADLKFRAYPPKLSLELPAASGCLILNHIQLSMDPPETLLRWARAAELALGWGASDEPGRLVGATVLMGSPLSESVQLNDGVEGVRLSPAGGAMAAALDVLSGGGRVQMSLSSPLIPADKKRKRSAVPGEARTKLVAALTTHHRYADGGCLNQKPIGNNELADLAEVAKSTVSKFFSDVFGGYVAYRARCADLHMLRFDLRLLNGELNPKDVPYGRTPPGEGGRRDDD
jgi:hypothetical protein